MEVRNTRSFRNENSKDMQRKYLAMAKEKKQIRNDPRKKLQQMVHNMRIKNIVNNFARKISMNSSGRNPVDYTPFEEKEEDTHEINGV